MIVCVISPMIKPIDQIQNKRHWINSLNATSDQRNFFGHFCSAAHPNVGDAAIQ